MTYNLRISAIKSTLALLTVSLLSLAFPVVARAVPLPTVLPKVAPDETENVEFAHPPYSQGLCGICHVRDDLKDPGPIKEAQSNICFTCHLELLSTLSEVKFLHKPTEKNCQYCHNPHTSNRPHLLIAQSQDLCTSCHKSIKKILTKSKVHHGAISVKKSCTNCHDPHGSNFQHRLRAKPYDLCIRCHSVDGLLDHDGKKMLNFKQLFEENPNRHAPVADKECSACHQPHGANVKRLLIHPYPATFYMPYKKQRYALCYECHFSKLIDVPETRRTGFRNANKNLHYVHVVQQKEGRSCRACHAVHASKQAFHIRESVPYGNSGWELKLNYHQTADGGSCVKTCHETRTYRRGDDRSTPVSPIQDRQMRTVSGNDMTLLNRDGVSVLLFLRPNQSYSRLVLEDLKTCLIHLADKPVRIAGVVPGQPSASSIKQMLAAVGLDFPVLIDEDFTLEEELGVKAYPQFQIINRDGVVMSEMFISKSNTCLPLINRIRYALGEITHRELTTSLNPPPAEAKKEEALVDRYLGLATVLLRNKKYKKAKIAVDLALKHDPASEAAQAILRAIATTQGDRPEFEVARVEGSIRMDGELAEYEDARPLRIRAGNATAAFWVKWNDEALYLAARVEDKDLWARGRGRDGDLRQADGIEILLDPFLERSENRDANDRQVIVTCMGDVLDARGVGKGKDLKINMGVKSAVVVQGTIGDFHTDKGYNVELSIPWKALGIVPGNEKIIGVNLILNNASEADVFSAGWARIVGYESPAYWNDLVLVDRLSDANKSPARSVPGVKAVDTTRSKTKLKGGDVKDRGTGCGCRITHAPLSKSAFLVFFVIFALFLWRRRRVY